MKTTLYRTLPYEYQKLDAHEQPDATLRSYGIPAEKTLDREHFGEHEIIYLHHIYQRLSQCCSRAVKIAVDYMTTKTRGFKHNRYRAKFSRKLKHCQLSQAQREAITDTILSRLQEGDIDEQFEEQLRFAKWLDTERMVAIALEIIDNQRQADYIIKYANKAINYGKSPIPKHF